MDYVIPSYLHLIPFVFILYFWRVFSVFPDNDNIVPKYDYIFINMPVIFYIFFL